MEDGRPLDPAYVTWLFQKIRTQGEPLLLKGVGQRAVDGAAALIPHKIAHTSLTREGVSSSCGGCRRDQEGLPLGVMLVGLATCPRAILTSSARSLEWTPASGGRWSASGSRTGALVMGAALSGSDVRCVRS